MEDLPLGRIAALVPEFAVKDLPLDRTLMMIMMMIIHTERECEGKMASRNTGTQMYNEF